MRSALVFADEAAAVINGPDEDWAVRTRRLRAQVAAKDDPPPAIIKRLRRQIALHRPGAIGDILMTLNLVPALRAANPDTDIHYFCAAQYGASDALGGIMHAAGVDVVMDCANIDAWRGHYDRVIDLIGYPLAEGYPERPMRRHLLRYFAAEMGLPELTDPTDLLSLTLARPEREVAFDGPYATLQWEAGWSSYKEWPVERWAQLHDSLIGEIKIVRINKGAGRTLAESIAVFANAQMHIGIDSFCNHLTNYNWTYPGGGRKVPAVILWGSTQASAAGYEHNTNISKGLYCQPCFRENPAVSRMPRGVCINPPHRIFTGGIGGPQTTGPRTYGDGMHQCMADITVDEVVSAVREMWERTK